MNNASATTSASNTPQTTRKKAASGSNWRTAGAANKEGLRGYGDTVMDRLNRQKNLPPRPKPTEGFAPPHLLNGN